MKLSQGCCPGDVESELCDAHVLHVVFLPAPTLLSATVPLGGLSRVALPFQHGGLWGTCTGSGSAPTAQMEPLYRSGQQEVHQHFWPEDGVRRCHSSQGHKAGLQVVFFTSLRLSVGKDTGGRTSGIGVNAGTRVLVHGRKWWATQVPAGATPRTGLFARYPSLLLFNPCQCSRVLLSLGHHRAGGRGTYLGSCRGVLLHIGDRGLFQLAYSGCV